jgi:hypothetical protein
MAEPCLDCPSVVTLAGEGVAARRDGASTRPRVSPRPDPKTSPVEMTSSAVAKMSVEAISSVMTKIPAAQMATLGDLVVPVAKVSFADRWTSVMALPEVPSSVQMPAHLQGAAPPPGRLGVAKSA